MKGISFERKQSNPRLLEEKNVDPGCNLVNTKGLRRKTIRHFTTVTWIYIDKRGGPFFLETECPLQFLKTVKWMSHLEIIISYPDYPRKYVYIINKPVWAGLLIRA